MDYSTILVKVTGAVLLIWTLRSIYKHFMDHKTKADELPKDDKKPSLTEQLLNNLLLYLWLAFMIIPAKAGIQSSIRTGCRFSPA